MPYRVSSQQELVTSSDVQTYFQESVVSAMAARRIEAEVETISYVVGLLVGFTRAEELFEATGDGTQLRPLAMFYADAVRAKTHADRTRSLKRLGDVALFVAGIFSDSLNRKVVDLDYYIAMGGNAYSHLSEHVSGTFRGKVFSIVFAELAEKFHGFVDVLGELSDNTHLRSDIDVLRLYEVWVKTGSERAAERLRALGIEPIESAKKSAQQARH